MYNLLKEYLQNKIYFDELGRNYHDVLDDYIKMVDMKESVHNLKIINIRDQKYNLEKIDTKPITFNLIESAKSLNNMNNALINTIDNLNKFNTEIIKIINGLKVVVFDFDCTLTSIHWWKTMWYNWAPDIKSWDEKSKNVYKDRMSNRYKLTFKQLSGANSLINYIWGGVDRLDKIKNFLDHLKNNNISLVISTNGQANEVKEFLKASDIDPKIFGAIHGYNDVRHRKVLINPETDKIETAEDSKAYFIINYLMEEQKYKYVVFIDDSPGDEYYYLKKEIKKEKRRTIDLPREEDGIQDKHINEITDALKINKFTWPLV